MTDLPFSDELVQQLKQFDSPTISNAIAQLKMAWATSPSTSVRRKSRPL